MGDLEQRVRALARGPVGGAERGDELRAVSQEELKRIVAGALSGIHVALLEIAGAVDGAGAEESD